MSCNALGIDDKHITLTRNRKIYKRCFCKSIFQFIFIHSICRNFSHTMMANSICYKSSFHRKDLRVLAEAAHADHTFLAIDARERTIRSKADGDRLFHFVIVCHAGRAALFIASHKDADSFIQRKSQFPDHLQCIKGCDRAAFVIGHAASINDIAFPYHGERITLPAVPLRNHIQMCDQTNDVIPFANLGITTVVVQILCTEPHTLSNG